MGGCHPVFPDGGVVTHLLGIVPARGLAYIKRISTAETYANSPILITAKTRDAIAACQFEVVSVGDYEWCKELDDCPRPHYKGGWHKHRLMEKDWVLCRNRSWGSTPDPDVFVVRVVDILGVFRELDT